MSAFRFCPTPTPHSDFWQIWRRTTRVVTGRGFCPVAWIELFTLLGYEFSLSIECVSMLLV